MMSRTIFLEIIEGAQEKVKVVDENKEPRQTFRKWGKQLFLGIIFVLFVTAFLHYRQVEVDTLELNTTASKYIVAQVDFSFPDEEATVILKQEAVRDIGNIYKIDTSQVHQKRFEFESYLIHHQEWRQELPNSTFEEMYEAANAIEKALMQSRYTDRRTMQKMRELGIRERYWYPFIPVNPSFPIQLPEKFWKHVLLNIEKTGDYQPQVIDFVMKYFQSQNWNIEEDLTAERKLRMRVQNSVPVKWTQISSGTLIVSPGERITERHIAMMSAMKAALGEIRNFWAPLPIIGNLLLSIVFTVLGAIYFYFRHRNILESIQKLSLLIVIIIITLAISKVAEAILLSKTVHLIDYVRYPIFVPLAALLISILISSEIALFVSAFLAVMLSLSLAVDYDRFLVINLIAGLVTILAAKGLHRRKEVFIVCAKVWGSCIVVIIAFSLLANELFDLKLFFDISSAFIFMLLTAVIVVGVLPILEIAFNVMTDMTLMEFMDPNNELLRRLSVEAPGTYQHCLVMSNLAEAAARAVGANGLFCRVATLYHDIGKLFNPHYFTENQLGGFNIHQLLTPIESAQVIISHVKEGEQLARRYRLPQSFIDIIYEHHGTTLVYYFYHKAVEQAGGDASKVDESQFRYPGPKPRTRESAILMISDTVEAASRSMDMSQMSEESLTDLVNRLVSQKGEAGQFDDCQLTFEELGIVKRTIIKTLLVSHHHRIKYPERKKTS